MAGGALMLPIRNHNMDWSRAVGMLARSSMPTLQNTELWGQMRLLESSINDRDRSPQRSLPQPVVGL